MQDETKASPPNREEGERPNAEQGGPRVSAEEAAELARNEAEGGAGGSAPGGGYPRNDAPRNDDPVAALQTQVEVLEAEKSALKDQMLRAVAEAENTRRRVERERGDAVKYAAIPLLRDVVKAADNLARALAALPEDATAGDDKLKSFRDGVALTERELLSALERHKVERIDPKGEVFDPNLHEAMMEMPDAEQAPGTVVQVLEVGWKLHDRLVRPARVAVARKP